jgi:hypothetical protein
MSHIKLWHTVVISKKHALKSVKDCLYGMEPPEFHPDNLKQDGVTLKKSLIERKHNILADISDYDLRVKTAMSYYLDKPPSKKSKHTRILNKTT